MFKELNILSFFLDSPNREFNVREIARLLRISPATASKQLLDFSKKSILKEKKERRFNFYSANLDSDLYRDIKVFYNIRKLKDSGLIDFFDHFYLKPTIILFGSAAAGLDTETSDFDLVIISEKTNVPEMKIYEEKLKRNLQIFAVKNLQGLRNEHLINSVLNGIILQGGIKWTWMNAKKMVR